MTKIRRAAMLTITLLFAALTLAGGSLAAENESEITGSMFQLNVVHTVLVDSLDEDTYTVWTSAMAVAIGRDGNGKLYFASDAALNEPDRFFDTLSEQLLALLESGGIYVTEDELPNYIKIDSTRYFLVYAGSNLALSETDQNVSDDILLLTPSDDSVQIQTGNLSYAYADTIAEGAGVHTYMLSGDDLDGIVSASEDAYVTNWSLDEEKGSVASPASAEAGSSAAVESTIVKSRASQGSALLDDSSRVIGLNIWSDDYEGTVSITSAAIMSIMDGIGISYDIAESSGAKIDISDALIYFIFLIAAIVILVVLLLILRARRRRREEEEIENIEQPEINNTHQRQNGNYTIRTAQPTQYHTPSQMPNIPKQRPAPKPTPQQAQIPSTVMVTILDGTMKGASLNIKDKITIGRDPAVCAMVFPADTTEISRRHCAITFNKKTGRVLLEDLNSSNGTYFPSGSRIIPGRLYALRNGDRFYLGLEKNMAEIRIQ